MVGHTITSAPKAFSKFFAAIGKENQQEVKAYYLNKLFTDNRASSKLLGKDTLDAGGIFKHISDPKNEQIFQNMFGKETTKSFKTIINNNLEIVKRLGRIKEVDFLKDINESVIKTVMVDENIRIQFDSDINLQDQKSIQIKKQQEILNKILISEKKLDNIGFVQNAPKNIVESEREMLSNYKNDLEKINNILKSFL